MVYHISYTDLGSYFLFTPCVPVGRSSEECSLTERICVAPSPIQALLAKEGVGADYFTRYRIAARPIVYCFDHADYIPSREECYDAPETGEAWILGPMIGHRLGWIDMPYLKQSGEVRLLDR